MKQLHQWVTDVAKMIQKNMARNQKLVDKINSTEVTVLISPSHSWTR